MGGHLAWGMSRSRPQTGHPRPGDSLEEITAPPRLVGGLLAITDGLWGTSTQLVRTVCVLGSLQGKAERDLP